MTKVKFTQIGTGVNHTSPKGKTSIRLQMDMEQLMRVPLKDWENGVYIFRSPAGYVVYAPVEQVPTT